MTVRRRRLAGVVLLGTLAGTLGLSLVPVPTSRVGPAGPPTSCIATGPLDSVEALNRFVEGAPATASFLGADVGVDVLLPDGRRVWLFGDTVRPPPSDPGIVRNSMLLIRPGCARVVPATGAVVPDRPDGVGYWPMSAWLTSSGPQSELHVMLQRVRARGAGLFDFDILGSTVATFSAPLDDMPRLESVTDLGADDTDPGRPLWGAAATQSGRWLYLFGTSADPVGGYDVRVARLLPQDVERQDRWHYWDGQEWTADPELAVPVLPTGTNASEVLSVFREAGTWYALGETGNLVQGSIVIWSATSVRGPFGPPRVVGELSRDPGEVAYLPLAHPELLPSPGTVVVGYSVNDPHLDAVCSCPSRYRPVFVRVPLPGP